MFIRRTALRSMLIGLAVAAMVAPACAAHADPSADEIQAKIDKGNKDLELVVEQYNKTTEDLTATQAAITKLEGDLKPLQSDMEAAQAGASQVAINAYKTGNNLRTLSLMLGASSSDGFVDRVGTLEQISRNQQHDIATYSAAKGTFDTEKNRLNEQLAAQTRQKTELETRRKQIEGDIARLDDMQRKADAAAAAAAAKAKTPTKTTTTTTTTSTSASSTAGCGSGAGTVVKFACAQLGKRYVYATAGPNTYDCSGLTMAAWKAAGVSLPHNAAQQWGKVKHISRSQLVPGDLVFYNGLGHVGIYIGNNQIIHAPNSRTVVKVAPIDIDSLYGYGRP
ncbi:C40 family peptidase [Dactylosporangium vinaceum]|uniref:NlpC/P60 family protein n=1 Tax=Dactylosporangium vinaceum TaxID=53362 RepID=A0ABV5M8I3_9ACTN|nr:C40 family peptidase [Dactylosporangium vinaceum]UAB94194.1 C40 family peptidase [Dactylosporangium vinaceum]